MNKFFLFIFLLFNSLYIYPQYRHKIISGMDLSYGINYFNSDINNPLLGKVSLGYEYIIKEYIGFQVGFTGGGFYQSIQHGNNEYKKIKNLYKGTFYAPFISSKFYYDINTNEKVNRKCYLFLENKFSYSYTNIDQSSLSKSKDELKKNKLVYEIKGGYEFPINKEWNIIFWIGYNTYDFGKFIPEKNIKTSTALELGIGFCYLITNKHQHP